MALHRKALAALAAHGARPDPARLAHHAEAADDAEAVLRTPRVAGERAAMLRPHREAAAQFARALRYAADLPRGRRAELLERRSYECYLTNDMAGASTRAGSRSTNTARRATACARATRTAWLSRLVWFSRREGDGRGRGSAGRGAARAATARP